MATGVTRLADIIVPEEFSQYVQQTTEEKSRLIASGAMVVDAALSALLAGGGSTFNDPSWKDLDNDEPNASTDDPTVDSSPNKIGTSLETQVRMSRNSSWSSMNMTAELAGADPVAAIVNKVAGYWTRSHQRHLIATIKGVFADNAAAPTGTEHVINDMTYNISGSSFQNGVTNFSAEAFIDATATMGDSSDMLSLVCMHSVVYHRAKKNNLIDFEPDSTNGAAASIPKFLGHRVIVDDSLPFTSGVYDTWIFGAGALRAGIWLPPDATEVERKASAGNGGGQDILYSRVSWIIHPVGYKYAGTYATGGPTTAATANNLAHADSWKRVFPERKQIRVARLITRES